MIHPDGVSPPNRERPTERDTMTQLASRKSGAETPTPQEKGNGAKASLSDLERDSLRLLRELAREAPRTAPVRPDQTNRYVLP
jgi:hypothetical protein